MLRSFRNVGRLSSKTEANSSKWMRPRVAMSAAIFSWRSAAKKGGVESLGIGSWRSGRSNKSKIYSCQSKNNDFIRVPYDQGKRTHFDLIRLSQQPRAA
jgi:hypothetical protein